jgi:hypothetical protein
VGLTRWSTYPPRRMLLPQGTAMSEFGRRDPTLRRHQAAEETR